MPPLAALLLACCAATAQACASWCNVYTCGLDACSECAVCTTLSNNDHCEFWCNSYTCGSQFCAGCDACYVPVTVPNGKWAFEMEVGKGELAGKNLTNFLNTVSFTYFRFEVEMMDNIITTYTYIEWFGAPRAGPIVSINKKPFYLGDHSLKDGTAMISNLFELNVPPKAPGAFPAADAGLTLCYDNFENPTAWYALREAFFSWRYTAATDTIQYANLPVFFCPASPWDDYDPMGGTGPWANTNPVMLDPFVKSFNEILSDGPNKWFPVLTRVA